MHGFCPARRRRAGLSGLPFLARPIHERHHERPPLSTLASLCRALLAAVAIPFVPAAATFGAQEPEFVALDPATVRATLVSADVVTKQAEGALVSIRVECPAGHVGGVQALALRVTPKAKGAAPVVVRRFDDPAYGRKGRAAFPGEACDVPLLVPLDAKAAKGAAVEVLEVSAWLEAPTKKGDDGAPVGVGRPVVDTGFDAERGQSLPRTTITLTNDLEHDVDVVLRAEFTNPRAGTSLVRGRALAKRATDLVVAAMPVGRGEFFGALHSFILLRG